jgi:hypothetical protein
VCLVGGEFRCRIAFESVYSAAPVRPFLGAAVGLWDERTLDNLWDKDFKEADSK